jgi:uncharacterized protein (TIGR02594 family)
VDYHATTSLGAKNDQTPWCSSFVNWVMGQSGQQGTGSAGSQSWRNWGQDAQGPLMGSIVVFSYGKGQGHVGFVVGTDKNGNLMVLGGNQVNQVNQVKISTFGIGNVNGYRVPSGSTPGQYPNAPTFNSGNNKQTTFNEIR